ncbi:unnamed protein product, partial [Choristocarpus tenellus]
MTANSNSAPGPDGMRPSHIRSAITTDVGHEEVAKAFAKLWKLAYTSPDSLPLEFWTLYTNSKLSTIGERCCPVASGSFFRRACASAFCTDLRPYLEEYFGGVGQFGVGVPNGIKRALLDIRLRNECGEWVISLDGRNAFNSVRHSAFIQALPETLKGLLPHVSKVYGNTRNIIFPLDERGMKVLPSRSGAQEGDPLGPLLYCIA